MLRNRDIPAHAVDLLLEYCSRFDQLSSLITTLETLKFGTSYDSKLKQRIQAILFFFLLSLFNLQFQLQLSKVISFLTDVDELLKNFHKASYERFLDHLDESLASCASTFSSNEQKQDWIGIKSNYFQLRHSVLVAGHEMRIYVCIHFS